MTLVRDNDTNLIYVLEHDGSNNPRVQIIPFENQSIPNLFSSLPSTNINQITTAVGICSYTSGVVVIGQGSKQLGAIARFPSGAKSFPNNWAFEFPELLDLSGNAMNLSSPSEIDCKGNQVAVAENDTVLIYEIPNNPNSGREVKTRDIIDRSSLKCDKSFKSTNCSNGVAIFQ